MRKLFITVLLSVIGFIGFGQGDEKELTQNVRGTIMDKVTQSPLPGASVKIIDSDPLKGATSDVNGQFLLPDVEVGRISLQVSYIGYETIFINQLQVTSGKEVVLNLELQESIEQLSEVTVKANNNPQNASNDLALVSARGFDMEETNRYAGARNDPARMAQNFAGVSGANDSRNDIIIRGNSPSGVLWRLEGIDIPNPNHFGALGTTGGPVSILNNNLLAKSDFMTSAFPSEYGNATAGVFDLKMRKGNSFKREHIFQVGFNGFELGTEGPIGEENGASYLLNYRYSTLALMDEIGLSPGTGNAVPYYQDFSAKVDVPTKKLGKFSLFAIGGKSNIDLLGTEVDTTETDLYTEISQNIYNSAKMGVVGLSNTQYYNDNTYGIFSLSADYSFSGNIVDSLSTENREPQPFYRNNYGLTKYRAQYHFHQKINAKHNYVAGFNYDVLSFNLQDSIYQATSDNFQNLRDEQGVSGLAQGFFQWQYRLSKNLDATAGLHYQYFAFNGSQQIEPRLGVNYQLNEQNSLKFGYGLHSQLQVMPIYFLETQKEGNGNVRTNENLDFTKSHHFVAGFNHQFNRDFKLRAEAYYQHLYDVAVERKSSSFSMLNAGADFGVPNADSLVNNGLGRNYGLELTLEKSFSKNYYFLFTTSLFESEYQGSDQKWRNTAFNSQYVLNGLFGREIELGSKNRVLAIDIKSTYAGGQYVTPIDLQASRQAKEMVLDHENAYSEKNPDYFRTDLKLSFRMNSKKLTHEWALDIQNVFNTQNLFRRTYNPVTEQIVDNYQLGIYPIPQYRLTF
ncbi:TonB-dependent receptor [Marivirga sp.]|uniref:TonB-dependent receptor n=1 Tax=Marivirga sp. TaxID=2018662 RepID=UPI003DA7062D